MAKDLKDSELVLGLISTVGTDVSEVIKDIRDELKYFNYILEDITVSKDILSQFENTQEDSFSTEFERIQHYMDLGNRIREETNDNSILMKGIARELYQRRLKANDDDPKPRKRVAYLLKSLKHPEEVQFMRETYGDGFYLIGVTSSKDRRVKYLTDHKGLSYEEAQIILDRDISEDGNAGQHTQDAFQHADFFINVADNTDLIYNAISRFIGLLFGNPFITPTFDEYAMFMAYAASLRSADLSRQIGVVIAKNKEILSTGANDCPKVGGGLYWPVLSGHKYIDEDRGRDYMLGFDSNKTEQKKIIETILENLGLEVNDDNRNKVKKAGIGDLTEYGRVVHGEMEALLSCARNNISCRGATLYATTFPCHNCAKHIIAAGIERVVYIEPYPKSKALEFYRKEISDGETEDKKVVFEHFVGVGPSKFIDLFAISSYKWYSKKRKDKSGKKIEWRKESAELRNPISVFTYLDDEKIAFKSFEEISIAIKRGE